MSESLDKVGQVQSAVSVDHTVISVVSDEFQHWVFTGKKHCELSKDVL